MNPGLPEYLILGKIIKPRGLKGEVKAFPFFKDLSRLVLFKEVYLEIKDQWTLLHIDKSVVREGLWYLFFQGVDSREKAEALGRAPISIPAKELGDLPGNLFYHFQLEGLVVKDASGRRLGAVSAITSHAAMDYLTVEGEGLITIPMVASLIEKIDLENGEILLKARWE